MNDSSCAFLQGILQEKWENIEFNLSSSTVCTPCGTLVYLLGVFWFWVFWVFFFQKSLFPETRLSKWPLAGNVEMAVPFSSICNSLFWAGVLEEAEHYLWRHPSDRGNFWPGTACGVTSLTWLTLECPGGRVTPGRNGGSVVPMAYFQSNNKDIRRAICQLQTLVVSAEAGQMVQGRTGLRTRCYISWK